LIELALGEKAQYLVVSPSEPLFAVLAAERRNLHGRVGFLTLDARGANGEENGRAALMSRPDGSGEPSYIPPRDELADVRGVVGRADQFIQTAAEHQPLVRRLLGRTWIVESLQACLALATKAPECQFVSLGGEMLSSDGVLSVGPLQASIGLISRRSELRALARQIADLERSIQELEGMLARLESELAEQDAHVVELTGEHQRAAETLAEQRIRFVAAQQRHSQLEQQLVTATAATESAEQAWRSTNDALADARRRLVDRQASLSDAEVRISNNARRVAELEDERQRRNRETMAAKIELARSEQQLEHLEAQLRQFERDREERQRAIADGQEHLAQSIGRLRETEEQILSSESELAGLYLQKESMSAQTAEFVAERAIKRNERAAAAEESQRHRAQIRKLEERLHQLQLSAGELTHQRTALVVRLRDDYGIESEALDRSTVGESRERSAIEDEIADLRRKLSNIGNVNLDSLHEAEELESRFQALASQFQDLSKAKASLEQIVGKINTDSRRLFGETLETVKGHFQELFRKLFGGGQADIVLEDGIDILDTGIEIVARPPGKEPRNISLLSGGEKTLTCVALLLAIFRSRPSPFCVLDEVDAALDEANTERFVAVLREFLAWTRFIVVTHSKKTMTAANTLYGVTMQESGVSKRVSVRFDDVSDNGEILESTSHRVEPADHAQRRAA
ncbi:MAG TPA: hypothetical protein VGH32_11565, partial [Pirellulales bacterium]